jgi:adenine deaminase
VHGQWLNAYVAAGVGSDHECTTVDEARERLRRGMYLFIREATGAHNLIDLLAAVTAENSRRCCLCTDDRHPHDLLEDGHIDYLLRLAIDHGLDPVTAIRMVTLNPAEWFRLHDRGAVAPGKRADLVVLRDLHDIRPDLVFSGGQLVAQDGQPVGDGPVPLVDAHAVRDTVHIHAAALSQESFHIPARSARARVIGVIEDQIVTEHRIEEIPAQNGSAMVDLERDILKIAVIERHQETGNIGRGFIQGMGLQAGAIAGSVAHDHHNIVVVGADDQSMLTAARAVAEMGGGLVAANGERVIARLALPIAGLMSEQPINVVRDELDQLIISATALGSQLHDPFMAMSFVALEVIPALKLTDQGLVDVEQFKPVPLFVD